MVESGYTIIKLIYLHTDENKAVWISQTFTSIFGVIYHSLDITARIFIYIIHLYEAETNSEVLILRGSGDTVNLP